MNNDINFSLSYHVTSFATQKSHGLVFFFNGVLLLFVFEVELFVYLNLILLMYDYTIPRLHNINGFFCNPDKV